MRPLSDFPKRDWLKLLPLRHAFTVWRNDVLQQYHVARRPANLPEFLRANAHLADKNLALIVAFEQPRVLDFMLTKAGRFVPDTHFLVFDNSADTTARSQIERVCREHRVPYLALPRNSIRHPNRSHGIAMTWIFHNVVRALRPWMFAYLDHDLIPFRTVDWSQALVQQPFYGPVRAQKSAEPGRIGENSWSLWAGYSLFDFSAVKTLPLNFLYDFSRGLDTGGRNWESIYKNYDPRKIIFADSRKVTLTDSRTGIGHQIRLVDHRWLHFRGTSYRPEVQEQLELYERMANALAENGAETKTF